MAAHLFLVILFNLIIFSPQINLYYITYYCITGPRSKEPRFAGNKVFFLPFAGKNVIIMKNVIIY